MHRAHDYRYLIRRWRAAARKAGLKLVPWYSASGYELYVLATRHLSDAGGIYMSAGIHGDEPASTEGLIEWIEQEPGVLRELPLLLFPCLNPWGLVNNVRYSQDGLDLNRLFHRDDLPFVQAWRGVVGKRQFSLAVMLHEDFDGQGLYLYEVKRRRPFWGEDLLDAARSVIPIEGRVRVDGHASRAGLIRRRLIRRVFEEIGYPEAVWLHLFHSERTFTFETPSEFALEQRVRAQVTLLRECVRRVKQNP